MPRAIARMVPDPGGPDIVEFATSQKFLGIDFLSVAQISILKALYGLAMERDERLAYLEMAGGREPRKGGYQDAAIICGTRGGKTLLASVIAAYESVKWGPHLSKFLIPGQVAKGILIAENRVQANEVRGYIEGHFHTLEDHDFEVLAPTQAQSKAVTGYSIRTAWPLEIIIYPPSKAAVRGATGLWFIGDEIAWWRSAEGSYNQDSKVIQAVRSRFATLSMLRPKRIMISSPNEEQGVLWDEYKKRDQGIVMVVNAPTWMLNPETDHPTSVKQEFLDAEQEKDAEAFMQEYGAVFSKASGGNTFLPAEIVDQCIVRGRLEVPPKSGFEYLGWMDAAFKRDRFSFGIGHSESTDGVSKVVIDYTEHWTPKKGQPLDDKEIVASVARVLRVYGADTIHGDQFADIPLKSEFQKHGIMFVEEPVTNEEKFDVFKNLRASLRAGLVELPDDPVVIRDLKGLTKTETKTGKVSIQAPRRRGAYDDAASVVSRLVARLLPIAFGLDLAEVNAAARVTDRIPGTDWKNLPPEGEFHGQLMEAVY